MARFTSRRTGTLSERRLASRLLVVVVTAVALLLGAASGASAADITSPGPLTRINISEDLNCQVTRIDDTVPEFFGGFPGACGTLLATGGTLFGPANIPAGGAASPRTPYTPVSQSATTGTGTSADPFRIVTVVDLGTTGLRITQTDTYVTGEESYQTDVEVNNSGTTAQDAILYRAGDCFLQNSDQGFGEVDVQVGAISCVAAADPNNPAAGPGMRIEQFFPISPGSSYLHDFFGAVWAAVGSQTPFPNQCNLCAVFQDNGAGLSWNITVPAGGSVTRSSLITFSPVGRRPLATTKTADSATSAPGANNAYTITITNPNPQPVTLTSITDTLPSGFVYRPGTTQEPNGQTDDPSVSVPDLTFTGPYTVPPNGSVVLRFGVTVSSTPGDYLNNARGDSPGFTVAPTGPTAQITVTAPPIQCAGEAATIVGTAGADAIVGTPGRDVIQALDGDDQVSSLGGNDLVCGGDGDDDLQGDSGKDELYGDHGDDGIFGNSGNDRLFGGAGEDELRGGTGNDRLSGAGGDDELRGDNGDDHQFGGRGNDELSGGRGDDRLSGASGNDELSGDSGNDQLLGGIGNDELSGDSGEDRLDGGPGTNQSNGGRDFDDCLNPDTATGAVNCETP